MSIFSKLFKKIPKDSETIGNRKDFSNDQCRKLWELKKFFEELFAKEDYIAKSEYKTAVMNYEEVIRYFDVLKNSGLLGTFCEQNDFPLAVAMTILSNYENIENLVDAHNEAIVRNLMIEEKQYLDNILKDVDSNILLDDDQRKVILTDEDYMLVIAGAGAGKTTTVAAKVKYLVEKKHIDPKQILVVSFTNKAVQELKDKLNKDLNIDCPIATFHSTGNAILRKQSPEKLNIVDSSKLYFVLQDYFKSSVMKNESIANSLILFFASYFEAPYNGTDLNSFFNKIAKSNFSTMRSDLDEFKQEIVDIRTKKKVTIQSEVMRSYQEVEIANFLYLNGIDYQYEPIYKYDILHARKPYTPDFVIMQDGKTAYIEHFGLTEDGKNDKYSENEIEYYKKAVKDKIQLHRKHETTLIYTFSKYNDGRSLQEHLKEKLEAGGFILKPRSNKEVMKKIVESEENRYLRKLINLICRFITNFKTNGFTEGDFARMYNSTQNVRTHLFLNICHDCYLEYQRFLRENEAVDFEDMINESARILQETKEMKQKLDFKYIIVDEYQDISRQHFDLVKALAEVTDAKIIAVGDDWQSIYAFSGSDITLFTKFAEKMGYAKLLKIVKTYRNSQEVIDIAGNFIQKNSSQIKKALKSPKHIADPVIIYTYDSTKKSANASARSGANYAAAHAVEIAIEQIMEFDRIEGKKTSNILVLGRFGFDGDKLEKSGLFEYKTRGGKLKSVKYPKLDLTFMTAHASKGLGYDNVIVINGRNETYGFPSKIEDDPVLSFVVKQDRSIEYAEERRLFYVAMTRTKNRVYFIAPEQNPSEFLLELKRDYKNIVLKGDWNEKSTQSQLTNKSCPMCGYPMQYRYKNAYGLRLYICTNEPEICGFMTNEYRAGKLSIIKCDQCRDGYLVVKPGKETYVLGCTNYKKDGTGCSRVMSPKYFFDFMKIKEEKMPLIPKYECRSKDKIVRKSEEKKSYNESSKAQGDKEKPSKQAEIKEIPKLDIKPIIYNGWNLNEVVHTVLQALSHMSEIRFYGVQVLLHILIGQTIKKVDKESLMTIPEFGMLKDLDKNEIEFIIKWLINNQFILQTKHAYYPLLHPTYAGTHYNETMTDRKLKKLKDELIMYNSIDKNRKSGIMK